MGGAKPLSVETGSLWVGNAPPRKPRHPPANPGAKSSTERVNHPRGNRKRGVEPRGYLASMDWTVTVVLSSLRTPVTVTSCPANSVTFA